MQIKSVIHFASRWRGALEAILYQLEQDYVIAIYFGIQITNYKKFIDPYKFYTILYQEKYN
jgi:hypothetical protein